MNRQGAQHSSFHSSLRSRESSSTAESDPREKIKDCCRKFVAFMCTQVGVGGLVVCYAIVGAFGFIYIEQGSNFEQVTIVHSITNKCISNLWEVTKKENVFNESIWKKSADVILREFQDNLAVAIRMGYDGRSPKDVWSVPAALMYCLSVFTMVGYGNMVPRTPWGKGATILYAFIGIPIYILYFLNMGKILAKSFKWLYTVLHECSRRSDVGDDSEVYSPRRKITVPSTACLWVVSSYILIGTIMFGEWEGWNYLDSTYFCVTSLCKIGFGDFVPGANISDSRSGSQTKLVINFVYMLFGMGLIAMCYNLMREDVKVKFHELKEDMRRCLDDISIKMSKCLSVTRYPGEF